LFIFVWVVEFDLFVICAHGILQGTYITHILAPYATADYGARQPSLGYVMHCGGSRMRVNHG